MVMAKKSESRSKRLTPDDWVAAALGAMVEGGVQAVRVEQLARQLKVSKGSFYWHFKNRAALLEAAVSAWEQRATHGIIAHVDTNAGTPRERLRALGRITFGEKSGDPEQALRSWAASEPEIAERIDVIDRVRVGYVRGLLVAAGIDADAASRRADILYRAIIGDSVWSAHGAPSIGDIGVEELLTMVLAGAPTPDAPLD